MRARLEPRRLLRAHDDQMQGVRTCLGRQRSVLSRCSGQSRRSIDLIFYHRIHYLQFPVFFSFTTSTTYIIRHVFFTIIGIPFNAIKDSSHKPEHNLSFVIATASLANHLRPKPSHFLGSAHFFLPKLHRLPEILEKNCLPGNN